MVRSILRSCSEAYGIEALLDGDAEKLTRKAIEMAFAGDGPALRLCMDRWRRLENFTRVLAATDFQARLEPLERKTNQ